MQSANTSNGLAFMKMHGLGNDFVVIDSRGREAVTTPSLARALGDRNRGVGFDQLAEIRDDSTAGIALDFWNADGTKVGACGNATRCVADYIMRDLGKDALSIRTDRGVLDTCRASDGMVSVNMGQPQLDWQSIGLAEPVDTESLPIPGNPVAVGMGNPHCVFIVEDILNVDVAERGSEIEHHPIYPKATNVEFIQVRSATDIRMRVWERGTGITLACGSGACAAAVAANLRGLSERTVRMELDGGWLSLDWRGDGVWMTGPTARVFDAQLSPEFLKAI